MPVSAAPCTAVIGTIEHVLGDAAGDRDVGDETGEHADVAGHAAAHGRARAAARRRRRLPRRRRSPGSGVMIVSPAQVNGAGPPCTVTCASVGCSVRRYSCSGEIVAVTLKLCGATWPTTSPMPIVWPTSGVNDDRMPAAPALTVCTFV